MAQTTHFSLLIQFWYAENHRNLPWRNTNSAYNIWLSEIILQQTRIDQGLSYYNRFCELFPTVHDLANASEKEILNTWQGLGYYSRARNLHKAAKQIVNSHNGVFPDNYADILALPGIGPYTAAAISSFAFNLPHAVLDGNVFRLLSRYFDISTPIDSTLGKKEFTSLAQELLDLNNPAQHNQATMEMGALICTPKSPLCHNCPLNQSCLALKNKTIELRPFKEKKIKIRNRYFHFLYLIHENKILLQQRLGKDIWENMYQLPLIELEKEDETPLSNIEKPIYKKKIANYTHQLSHQKINATFWTTDAVIPESIFNNTHWVPLSELNDFPLPRLIDRFLEEFHLKPEFD